jgi:hypothetical protein
VSPRIRASRERSVRQEADGLLRGALEHCWEPGWVSQAEYAETGRKEMISEMCKERGAARGQEDKEKRGQSDATRMWICEMTRRNKSLPWIRLWRTNHRKRLWQHPLKTGVRVQVYRRHETRLRRVRLQQCQRMLQVRMQKKKKKR